MENASKALLIGASVLVGVIVFTLAFYLYSTFNQAKRNQVEAMYQNELSAFNAKYLQYDGREDLTFYDIVNIATMAYNDWNPNAETKEAHGPIINISVKRSGAMFKNYTSNAEPTNLKQEIENFNSSFVLEIYDNYDVTGNKTLAKRLVNYKCKVTLDDATNYVKKLEFTKV